MTTSFINVPAEWASFLKLLKASEFVSWHTKNVQTKNSNLLFNIFYGWYCSTLQCLSFAFPYPFDRLPLKYHPSAVIIQQFGQLDFIWSVSLLGAVTVSGDYWVRCFAKLIKITVHNMIHFMNTEAAKL